MGVHNLWELLAPVGRRVSVETLAGKRLAVDASIWMIQFMKAMRDEKGEMVRNAHILGFFRRICKLLFLRTKPVFVFDGGTPALKRRTVIARRRQRENAQAKIRKTAEKLLMNHVRSMKLKKLAEDLKNQNAKNNLKGKEVMVDQSNASEKTDVAVPGHNQEMIDEMLVASLLAEECDGLSGTASTSAAAIGSDNGNASAATFPTDDEDDENDEEMILPVSDGNVDPAVLASLPPSMQLDLLGQMRERLMAENRQKYQKVKKAPQKFSELQIEAYLKTVAFRREINAVQKAAAGKGVAGVQTSRIASEANREFIFSSSFSGDKQLLASGGAEKDADKPKIGKKNSALDIMNAIASTTKSNPRPEPTADEPLGNFVDDVETYLDDRGCRRVSRGRAMGIRMTRDLQRNIDLMKELEQERTIANTETVPVNLDGKGVLGKSHCEGQSPKALDALNSDTVPDNSPNPLLETLTLQSELSHNSENCLRISFDGVVESKSLDDDDEFFACLAAGKPVENYSADNSASDCEWEEGMTGKECFSPTNGNRLEISTSLANGENNNESDVEWEEGTVSKKSDDLTEEKLLKASSSHAEDGSNNESDVEWEEGSILINDGNKLGMKSFHLEDSKDSETGVEWLEATTELHKSDPESSVNVQQAVSKGSAEEEAALQEAIRRSLEDLTDGKTSNISRELEKSGHTYMRPPHKEDCSSEPSSKLGNVLNENDLSQSFVAESDRSNILSGKGAYASVSPDVDSRSAAAVIAVARTESAAALRTKEEVVQIGNSANDGARVPTHETGGTSTVSVDITVGDDMTNGKEAAQICDSTTVSNDVIEQAAMVVEKHTSPTDVKINIAQESGVPVSVLDRGIDEAIPAFEDEDNAIAFGGASLEDELLVLDKEYKNLGDEQRKLERNADSVSSEMFVECQELLQMFGLPYIIAPMEAEAQCAYMELANLVDGVVTDDSDVFLFGARSVYKNIFDDRKYVETYFMKDIENELGLNREKLVRMALLLGSDYTEGVSGIGIVNAIEVLNAFPEENGLHKFREWIESPDPSILGKMGVQPGSTPKKKGSKASRNAKSVSKSDVEGTSTSDCNASQENDNNQAVGDIENTKQIFMEKHRNVSKNWHIPSSFPSDAVISAYIAPQVDKSTEPFSWGKPDIFSLRRLCWEKIGWPSQKADELLVPVLKEYNKHETQLRLEAFYTFNEKFAKIRSKRIRQAVRGITGKQSSELTNRDDLQEVPGTMKKGNGSTSDNKSKRKKSHTMRDPKEGLSSEGGSIGLPTEAEKVRLNSAGISRAKGTRKGKAAKRGRRTGNSDSEDNETCSHNSDSSPDEHKYEVQAGKVDFRDSVRRSKRARKATNYVEKDEEYDELCGNGEPAERTLLHHQNVPRDDVADSSRDGEFTAEDPSSRTGDVLAGDDMVNGCGFCASDHEPEMENNLVGLIESENAPTEVDKDYLQMGGGFCIEENEDESAAVAGTVADITMSSDEEAVRAIDNSELVESLASAPDVVQPSLERPAASDSKLNAGDHNETKETNVTDVAEKINDDADAATSLNAFSAIPFMKRKKRKT